MRMSDETHLTLSAVSVLYSNIILALRGVSFSVPRGSMVALLGANGAGKTTTLKAISNLLSVERGRITEGKIVYEGHEIGEQPEHLVRKGIVQVLEGRRCFLNLSVEENFGVAAYNARRTAGALIRDNVVYDYFPALVALKRRKRAFSRGANSRCSLLDARSGATEAPSPRRAIHGARATNRLPNIRDPSRLKRVARSDDFRGSADARIALRHADFGYVLSNGMVLKGGPAAELSQSEDIKKFYLGIGENSGAGEGNNAMSVDWMI